MPDISNSLSGTRSSAHWPWKPGSFDRLNLRYLFPSDNAWGIPEMDKSDSTPKSLTGWHDITAIRNNPDCFIHFFLDDYHFESVWNKPERSTAKVGLAAGALAPDFSVYAGMPRATQIYNVYRSCWAACYWQSQGIDVIPTAQWAEPDTFDFCFAGIPFGGTVAVSALGLWQGEIEAFNLGLKELMWQKEPSHLVVYGKKLPGYIPEHLDITYYPTHWDSKRAIDRGVQLWAGEADAGLPGKRYALR